MTNNKLIVVGELKSQFTDDTGTPNCISILCSFLLSGEKDSMKIFLIKTEEFSEFKIKELFNYIENSHIKGLQSVSPTGEIKINFRPKKKSIEIYPKENSVPFSHPGTYNCFKSIWPEFEIKFKRVH